MKEGRENVSHKMEIKREMKVVLTTNSNKIIITSIVENAARSDLRSALNEQVKSKIQN